MMIDTNTWHSFKFADLIDEIYKATAYTKDIIASSDKKIPFVTRTEKNNSVDGYADSSLDLDTEEGNAITIGDTTATATYQPKPFVCGDHMVVIRAKWINPWTGLFICTLLNNERFRYCYGRAFVMDLIKETELKLPVTSKGQPDWDWIESYMTSLNQSEPRTQNPSKKTRLQTNTWKTFVLSDILQIINGKGITSEEIDNNPGNLEAVQSGETNNGVIGFIDKTYCQTMGYSYCDQPCLSLARTGSAGFVSYHSKGCVVGDSAKILLLKHQVEDPHTAYLFLQTLLTANRFKYTYGRKVTETLYEKTVIKLPVNDNGQPDWLWIKNYIKSLPYGDCL